MARIAVLGATGGLGWNVVREATRRGHDVRVLVRDPNKRSLPRDVEVQVGDAAREGDVERAARDADAVFFCVNPPLATWMTAFPPLLDAAVEGCRRAGAKLVFPANVWVFGEGQRGRLVAETQPHAPCSDRGRLRSGMEARLRSSGVRFALVRLPEFYGPNVTTLTGPPLSRALAGRPMLWFGSLDAPIELVFMPDGAKAMVEVGLAEDGADYHVPGLQTTARAFLERARRIAGTGAPTIGLSTKWLRAAGLVHPLARAVSDIAYLWTSPVLLDGARYRARFGPIPQTPYDEGVAETLDSLRAHPVTMPF